MKTTVLSRKNPRRENLMKFAKNHPGIILFAVSIAIGQYLAFRAAPAPVELMDWLLTMYFGACFLIITVWPVMLIMAALYWFLGWWEDEELV